MKVPKPAVGYTQGEGRSRCRDCKYLETAIRCLKVGGVINPLGWCRLFKKRKGKVRA